MIFWTSEVEVMEGSSRTGRKEVPGVISSSVDEAACDLSSALISRKIFWDLPEVEGCLWARRRREACGTPSPFVASRGGSTARE